jgi:hypothetical protein
LIGESSLEKFKENLHKKFETNGMIHTMLSLSRRIYPDDAPGGNTTKCASSPVKNADQAAIGR